MSSYNVNGENDEWTVGVYVNDVEVANRKGRGSSAVLRYDYNNGDGPALPPNTCNLVKDECCQDSDCRVGEEVCYLRTCIDNGNPRFTLSWTGDHDFDLSVTPPIGESITLVNRFDEASGGRFTEDGVQFFFGDHIENIVFPLSGGPFGRYEYDVGRMNPDGPGNPWVLQVFVNGEEVHRLSGTGVDNGFFEFSMGSNLALADIELLSDGHGCSTTEKECCTQQDCSREGEICSNHNCIDTLKSGLRVTLTWTGEDDLDLFAYSPIDTSVSYMSPYDSVTGGIFAETGTQFGPGNHVENILFPDKGSGSIGEYTFEVKPFNNNPQDKWRLEVYTDEHLAMVKTGLGPSDLISFDYGVVLHELPSDAAHEEPAKCNESLECCIDDDCPSRFQRPKICQHNKCITQGHLRFTLEWDGGEDATVAVTTPDWQIIDSAGVGEGVDFEYQSTTDEKAIANLETKKGPGASTISLTNLYFPQAIPEGTFVLSVKTLEGVSWKLTILLNGVEASMHSGTGSTATPLFFEYPLTS